jgi:PAS domain S-box-containing protein
MSDTRVRPRRRLDVPLFATVALLATAVVGDPSALRPAVILAATLSVLVLLAIALQRAATARGTTDARRLASELGASLSRLAASEERYRGMVENAADPILTFDLGENVTSMNRAAEHLFGWEREALIGAPARRLFADESVRALARWTRESLLTPSEPAELEVTAVHREGRILHLETRAVVLRNDGVPLGTEVVCRDITARKELDRLRADFLAMMGHDIRNPLGAIFGYTEMMLDAACPLAPEHRELLMRINNNTRTVLTLVGNFLEASKIEAGELIIERRSIDANAVLQRTAEQYAAHAQLVGVELLVAPTGDLPAITADALQVERIVANLVTNAIKFTPRGGRVTLTTERLPSSVAIAVADTGVGIPRHEFSRIFERYARTGDRSHEGTGLGLYIVGTLVEAHGGFVTIDSTPGVGTTFTVYLPIADWRGTADAVARPAASATALH